MSELIPENMNEIQQKMIVFKQQKQNIDEDQFIEKTVQDIFQAYLDGAEEGHYDSCKIVDHNKMQVLDIMGQETFEFKSEDETFIDDFRKDSFKLELALEDYAAKIAKG